MAAANIDAINSLSPSQIKEITEDLKRQAEALGAQIVEGSPWEQKAKTSYNEKGGGSVITMPTHLNEAEYLEALLHEVGHVINNRIAGVKLVSEEDDPKTFAKNEIKAEATGKVLSDTYGIPRPDSKDYSDGWAKKAGLTENESKELKEAGESNAQKTKQAINQGILDGMSVGDLISDPNNAFNNMLPNWAKDWFNDVGNSFKNLFNNWGRNWFNLNRDGFANFRIAYFDPITLDLDGDGIETIGHNGTDGVMFDADGDGIKNPTGWVHPDDGLLVYDRNNDGLINNGTELFGDSTILSNGKTAEHGFAALADLDSNKDGVIDAKDAAFSKLKIWRDLNGDGISQANELFTLNELGIASLNLEYQNVSVGLAGNNQLAQIGSYTRTDGTTGQMGDVNFNFDRLNNGFTDPIELTPEQQKAANVTGMGRLRDLREAAALSADLAAKLEAYTNAKTKEAQMALLPGLLEAWARTDPKFNSDYNKINFDVAEHDPNSGNEAVGSPSGNGMILISNELRERWKDAALLTAILDSFTNMTTDRLAYISAEDAERMCNVIESTYAGLFQANYDALLLQTRLKPYVDAISLTIKDGELSLDFAPVLAKFEAAYAQDAKNAFIDLGEFIASQQKDHTWVEGIALFSHYIDLAKAQGVFAEFQAALGQYAFDKMGYLFGSAGNDTLTGGSNNNILEGGAGNDLLKGGDGDDTYIFNRGDGQDVVHDFSGKNTLIFKDLSLADARFMNDNGNLVIFGAGTDKVTVTNFFTNNNANYYQTFQFAGQTITKDEFWKNGLPLFGNEKDNFIYGWGGANIIKGGSGNETIITGAGNDYIYGGAGDDIIESGAGDDILEGGTGNDLLKGGDGDDTYIFNRGDGQDVVHDFSGSNTLIFRDLSLADARFMNDNGNLVIFGAGTDKVTVTNFFTNNNANYYQTFQFAGQTITKDEFWKNGLPLFGNEKDNSIYGWGGANIIQGGSGNETIITGAGNDRIYGGAGDDIIESGAGDDILEGGTGNDLLKGGDGDDTYIFNRGDGQDVVHDFSGSNTLIFRDLNLADTRFMNDNGNLVIFGAGTDKVTVTNFFTNNNANYYQTFKFADQTITKDEFWKNGLPLFGNEKDNPIYGWGGANIIHGGSGNETITTGVGNNIIYGGAGNDTINGNGMINGGSGNDTINLIGTNNTILFNLGDNQDVVWNAGSTDKIVFGSGITADMVELCTTNYSVYFKIGNDELWLGAYYNSSNQLKRVEFADGTVWTDIRVMPKTMYGTAGNDNITGVAGDNIIYAGAGNDTVTTGSGNDIISGGAGNDQLNGGAGDDTYLFDNNHGKDTITDSSGNDTISFTGSQQAENLWFSRQGNNLLIETLGSSDSITVNNWFSNVNYQIETIQLSNGQAIINQQVQSLINAMASFAPDAGSSIDVATQKQDYLAQIGISSYWEK